MSVTSFTTTKSLLKKNNSKTLSNNTSRLRFNSKLFNTKTINNENFKNTEDIEVIDSNDNEYYYNSNQYVNEKIHNLELEFPYTCGTWFNRGKNTCNFIKERLEKDGFKVYSTVIPYKVGDKSGNYNGYFNVYLNENGRKELVATSNENSSGYFHNGLKYFAFSFYKVNSNGEHDYLNDYPHKNSLLDFISNKIKTKYQH